MSSKAVPLPENAQGQIALVGQVHSIDGTAVTNGSVKIISDAGDGREASTAADGAFVLPSREPKLLEFQADGYVPRVVAAAPGQPISVNLTPVSEGAISIRFGGDVMFGRRFHQTDDGSKPLISDATSVEQHHAVMSEIEPLLKDSDLTVVNLETPLLAPEDFLRSLDGDAAGLLHADKEFAFASSTAAAQAMKDAGINVVALGNNHIYDALEHGVQSTLDALDEAGIAHFGGGRNEEEAWAPLLITLDDGRNVAFVGCTSILGNEHEIPYVAGADNGGAAACTSDRLKQAVEEANTLSDTVVVMIHGGDEYVAEQTPFVQDLTSMAVDLGATAVINSHPHVVGALRMEHHALVAETTGNLIFDQTLWDTAPSYLVRADIASGKVLNASADPLLVQRFVPVPAVGDLATAISRTALAAAGGGNMSAPGPALVPNESAGEVRFDEVSLRAGELRSLEPGVSVREVTAGIVQFGHDLLLGTGSFEHQLVGNKNDVARWTLGEHVVRNRNAQCSREGFPRDQDEHGLAFARGGLSTEDAIATIDHRIPVTPGTELTLALDVRSALSGGVAEVRWYSDSVGGSFAEESIEIPPSPRRDSCETIMLDVTVPHGTYAVQPFLRLTPPGRNQAIRQLRVDNVKLIQWSDFAAEPTKRWDAVRAIDTANITVQRESLPLTNAWEYEW
ncbi:hypothetical protein GCM10011410_05890 [Hoyosella rhizosphaerae]|uniref:Capsule synthesis protein CapA domain-containing protein n=1 Tax=Hoyosella rhizosphaerae TaxID=1755582 RepID=A0A916U223_9ACTN|nr:hypothetical protein GCM10011410_05890 [Hoyosella rhizosphaerae]